MHCASRPRLRMCRWGTGTGWQRGCHPGTTTLAGTRWGSQSPPCNRTTADRTRKPLRQSRFGSYRRSRLAATRIRAGRSCLHSEQRRRVELGGGVKAIQAPDLQIQGTPIAFMPTPQGLLQIPQPSVFTSPPPLLPRTRRTQHCSGHSSDSACAGKAGIARARRLDEACSRAGQSRRTGHAACDARPPCQVAKGTRGTRRRGARA